MAVGSVRSTRGITVSVSDSLRGFRDWIHYYYSFPKWYIMVIKASQDPNWLIHEVLLVINLGFTLSLDSLKPHVWPEWLKLSQYFDDLSAQMCIFIAHFRCICDQMCIFVQMSILMSNGGGFLEVIRVLQRVGPQIRAVGMRKWSDWWNLSIISVI